MPAAAVRFSPLQFWGGSFFANWALRFAPSPSLLFPPYFLLFPLWQRRLVASLHRDSLPFVPDYSIPRSIPLGVPFHSAFHVLHVTKNKCLYKHVTCPSDILNYPGTLRLRDSLIGHVTCLYKHLFNRYESPLDTLKQAIKRFHRNQIDVGMAVVNKVRKQLRPSLQHPIHCPT